MNLRRLFACAALALAVGPAFASDLDAPPPPVPTWPLAGTDADVRIMPSSARNRLGDDGNIRIVSKIGADLAIENNVNVGSPSGDSFSGGADLTQPYYAPRGFNPYVNQAEMAFMLTDMPEDDGAAVLAVSKSNRRPMAEKRKHGVMSDGRALTDIMVDSEEPPREAKDQVRSWVVASGQNLRQVLQTWCDREGWDLIWNTPREYPIAASAVFKGRFLDVSSALVRNFSRATPIPYAKFYKGNRVLVISTTEDD